MSNNLTPKAGAYLSHELNRAWCKAIGQKSDRPWNRLSQKQRDERIAAAELIFTEAIKSPDQSHERWLTDKLLTGWKYGERKNNRTKSHPCMLPRDQLPAEEKIKDDFFFYINTLVKRAAEQSSKKEVAV